MLRYVIGEQSDPDDAFLADYGPAMAAQGAAPLAYHGVTWAFAAADGASSVRSESRSVLGYSPRMVQTSTPVWWAFVPEDERVARELMRLAAVLERQGIVQNHEVTFAAYAHALTTLKEPFAGGIVVFVASEDALAAPWWRGFLNTSGEDQDTRLVVVVARPVPTDAIPNAARRLLLPKDLAALVGRPDRDDAMLDVVQTVRELAEFRLAEPTPPAPSVAAAAVGTSINDIFRLNGPPTHTFVEPPLFRDLQLELRTMGTGLILEGPSKTGKSTATRKAMDSFGVPSRQQTWWEGQRPPELGAMRRTLDSLVDARESHWLFIDDFHYLNDEALRRELAFAIKALADQPVPRAKVTLIGINPLGESLLQTMPDLAGRFRIMRLHRDAEWQKSTRVLELILRGEAAANIRFTRRDEFVQEARGSFFIAQFLCNQAARRSGVFEAQTTTRDVRLGPLEVVEGIRDELSNQYRSALLDFCAFDEEPRPRGAGLSLLWLLSRSSQGFVSIREAELRYPRLKPVFDWFLSSNLTRCFERRPELRRMLYYNRATATITMEEPQLEFFLRHLDWVEFARASGHGAVPFHPEDGPLWPIEATSTVTLEPVRLVATAELGPAPSTILHLSDLHLSSGEDALLAYSQLAQDLREMHVQKLDGLVLSGDVVNRAEASEYSAAESFVGQLKSGFALRDETILVTPGNHDVNWTRSQDAYVAMKRSQLTSPPNPESIIDYGPVLELRDDAKYRLRAAPFAAFHERVTGLAYPLDAEHQFTIVEIGKPRILILGLNSAWHIDHHYRDRASIHVGALSRALDRLPPAEGEWRVAVFHHPLVSPEAARLSDDSFMQRLAVAGFRMVLHGHVHRSDSQSFRYDQTVGGRNIEIVTAGTFGAPVREWVPGYPLQYNLLRVYDDKVIVETRKRSEVGGAWSPDARWLQGAGKDPAPRYTIMKRPGAGS